jgi:hypothetical protein
VEDFAAYVAAGVTSFDTADIYGPSESLIGHYLKHHPAEKPHVQVRPSRGSAAWPPRQRCLAPARQQCGQEQAAEVQAGRLGAPLLPDLFALGWLGAGLAARSALNSTWPPLVSSQVLTKFCCFGDMMRQAKELRYVEQVCVLVGVWRGGVRGLQRLVPCSVG